MSKPDPVEMRPLWSQEACETCGAMGYATRTQRRPKAEPYICGECEAAAHATASANAATQTERAELRATVTRLAAKFRRVEELLERNGCDCECGHGLRDHDDGCYRCLACRISEAIS